jgi:hypothetical protein
MTRRRLGTKTKRKRMTHGQVRRLEAIMPAALAFIEAHIPEDVRRAKTTHAFDRYRAAMRKPLDTDEGLTERGLALQWAVWFIMENYSGPGNEIADALVLLGELGLMDAVPEAPGSSAKQ